MQHANQTIWTLVMQRDQSIKTISMDRVTTATTEMAAEQLFSSREMWRKKKHGVGHKHITIIEIAAVAVYRSR